MPPKAAKVRKIDEEHRVFLPSWETEYFFTEKGKECVCLICQAKIGIFKSFNLRDHYKLHKVSYDKSYPPGTEVRNIKVSSLKKSLNDMSMFVQASASSQQNYGQLIASLKVASKIVKAKKPFKDADYIKDCAMVMVESIATEKESGLLKKMRDIPLSRQTATRRVEKCVGDVNMQMREFLSKSIAIGIAVDESTDVRDIAQCAIFVRCITADGELLEDILELHPLMDRTRGADVLAAVTKSGTTFDLPLDKVYSVTTDGAPAMVGRNTGLVALFKGMRETRDDVIGYHCIIHQEHLAGMHGLDCGNLKEVMAEVVLVVNFIRGLSSLNHRQFRLLLDEYDTQYGDIICHTNVRWLSQGRVLERVCVILDPIIEFMDARKDKLNEKLKAALKNLRDLKWQERLFFLADITSHLNDLNVKLQGKDSIVSDLYCSVCAFKNKLKLYKSHLSRTPPNVTPFPRLSEKTHISKENLQRFVSCIDNLSNEFSSRFSEFEGKKAMFSFVINPFLTETNELVEFKPYISDDIIGEAEMELIELQNNDVLKIQHGNAESPLAFWKLEPMFRLKSCAFVVLSMFGSTYRCEQAFSIMNYVKNKYRSRLTPEHTSQTVKAGVTSLEPRYEKIAKDIQAHPSH